MKRKIHIFLATMVLFAMMWSCSKENNITATDSNMSNPTIPETVEWIDLNLPSGVLWASHNVGAISPEDYGDYFAWGETQTKTEYGINFYKYANQIWYNEEDFDDTATKYCPHQTAIYQVFTDGLTVLQPSDDAATTNWGNGTRTPTYDEWKELLDYTTSKWTNINGVTGRLLTASNGNSIFLPATGGFWDSHLVYSTTDGIYWSSQVHDDYCMDAWAFNFTAEGQSLGKRGRTEGHTVRAVKNSFKSH